MLPWPITVLVFFWGLVFGAAVMQHILQSGSRDLAYWRERCEDIEARLAARTDEQTSVDHANGYWFRRWADLMSERKVRGSDENVADDPGNSGAGCGRGAAASTDGAETADQPCIKEYNGIIWFGPSGRC